MKQELSAQTESDALNKEYKAYITKLQANWLAQNRVKFKDVYEVLRPEEQAVVHQRVAEWGRYITPLAEAWWKERGYSILWPADNSKPIKVSKLKAA